MVKYPKDQLDIRLHKFLNEVYNYIGILLSIRYQIIHVNVLIIEINQLEWYGDLDRGWML